MSDTTHTQRPNTPTQPQPQPQPGDETATVDKLLAVSQRVAESP
jgi:hypothetical protein